MNVINYQRPKLSRNKYGFTTTYGAASIGNTNESTNTNTNTELDTHYFWGQPYNGTQDVNGDLDVVGNCSLTGNLVAENVTTRNDLNVGRNAYIDVDLHVGDTLNSTYINNSKSITTNDLTAYNSIKTKNLTVTGQAKFFELVIDKITSMGGNLMITPVDGFTIDYVEETDTTYYLFWRSNKDGKAIKNMWKNNDQALCMNFNQAAVGTNTSVENTYYWALVTYSSINPQTTLRQDRTKYIDELLGEYSGTGNHTYFHFISISKNGQHDGTLDPQAGQDIVMCGSRRTDDPDRQSALYLATYDSLDLGITAPFIAQYTGIKTFELSKYRKSYFDAKSARFVGDFEITGELEQTLQEKVQEYMEQHPVAVPYIGGNGNWWIDGRDTGVKAEGQDGQDGNTPYIGDNGNWWIGNEDTGVKAQGETGGKGDPGQPGEDGDDGLTFIINPSPVQFTTDDNGKVNEDCISVSITAKRGNTTATISSVTDGTTVNCGFYKPSEAFTGVTSWLCIRESDYVDVKSIKGTSYIAPTTGTAIVNVVIDGVTYALTIGVNVDVKKFLNDFTVTLKEFKSEYQTFETTTNGTLTAHSSLIQQNAEQIALKVDEVDVYPNFYTNPIYVNDEYRIGTGTNAFGFNSGTASDKAKFSMAVSDSFFVRPESGVTKVLVSPFVSDGGRIYNISKTSSTSDVVSLYALNIEDSSTAFLNRRIKLKGGVEYTLSMWIAMPDEYNKANFYDILNGYNVAEINFWNEEKGIGLQNRTFRKNLIVSENNVASKNGYWKQYYITFTTPRSENITMGSYTAYYGTECWMSIEPLVAVKANAKPSNIYFAGIKLEVGNKATPMSSTYQNLLATGIDIANKKITFTADNVLIQNNSGDKTFNVNENGSITIGGFVTPEPVIITADNLMKYVKLVDANTYWVDFMKCGNVIIIQSLPTDFTRTNSLIISLPTMTSAGMTEENKMMARRYINQKIVIINKTSEQFATTGVIYKKGSSTATSQLIGQNQCFIATQRYYMKNDYETIDWEYEIGNTR